MVRYHLDQKKGREKAIFLDMHHHGQRLKVYTGKKIEASKWDVKACRANPRKYKTNPTGFNAFLQEVEDEIVSLINENKSITKAEIKAIIDKQNGMVTDQTFFGFAESHLKQQIDKGEMLPKSAKAYNVTLNHLKKLNPRLDFKDVDLNFHDKFIAYLRREKISTNSIGGHTKRLKWFMSAALDRDLHSNVSFKKKAFKTSSEETDQIYLTWSEIRILRKKALPERLKRVADAFVMNCYMGLRYSDLIQIQEQNFKKVDGLFHLYMVQDKTKERIDIPVRNEVEPLLRKYRFVCPVVKKGKLMSVQKFNEYLKEAAIEAELNELVDIRKNGQVLKAAKHDQIKSHTARRTFATNLYLEGVPIQNIMAVTGHKKEETFLLYIRADQLTRAKGLTEHYKNKRSRPTMKVSKGGKTA